MTNLRDTVVIGASTGGIEALSRIFPVPRSDFPAAVLERDHDQVQGVWPAVRALFERIAADMGKALAEHEYRGRSREAKLQAETLRAFVLELVGA